jgi:hypothetical protein
VYAFCTHDRPVGENRRERWMSGRAVMTIVASRMIIRYVARMMARTTDDLGDEGRRERRRGGRRREGCVGTREVRVDVMVRAPFRRGRVADKVEASSDKKWRVSPDTIRRYPPLCKPIVELTHDHD